MKTPDILMLSPSIGTMPSRSARPDGRFGDRPKPPQVLGGLFHFWRKSQQLKLLMETARCHSVVVMGGRLCDGTRSAERTRILAERRGIASVGALATMNGAEIVDLSFASVRLLHSGPGLHRFGPGRRDGCDTDRGWTSRWVVDVESQTGQRTTVRKASLVWLCWWISTPATERLSAALAVRVGGFPDVHALP